MLTEFAKFLKEFNVVSLAVGFVMGTASTALVNSLVKDVLMPLAAPLTAAGSWKEAVFRMGPVAIAYGSFLEALVNFVILALIIFVVARKILKVEKAGNK